MSAFQLVDNDEKYYSMLTSKERPVISFSSLKLLLPELGGSPKTYNAYLLGKNDVEGKALEFGKILHAFLQNEDNFSIADVTAPSSELCKLAIDLCIQFKVDMTDVSPEGKKAVNRIATDLAKYAPSYSAQKRWEEMYKHIEYYLFWRENYGKPNLHVLDKSQGYMLRGIASSLKEKRLTVFTNPKVLELDDDFIEVKVEQGYAYEYEYTDPVTGEIQYVTVKIKPDHEIHYKNYILVTDFKSTSHNPYNFKRSIETYRYDVQAAIYKYVLQKIYGKQVIFQFLACGKLDPFEVVLHRIEDNMADLEVERYFVEANAMIDSGLESGWLRTPQEAAQGFISINL